MPFEGLPLGDAPSWALPTRSQTWAHRGIIHTPRVGSVSVSRDHRAVPSSVQLRLEATVLR